MSGGYHGAQWGMKAWGSIFYLVVFGSLITYTAYIYLLDNVAVSKVATYAYVNPVIAVILGAIFLHERFVAVEYVGMGANSAGSVSGDELEDEERQTECGGRGSGGAAAGLDCSTTKNREQTDLSPRR